MKKLALVTFVSVMLVAGVAAQPSGQAPDSAPTDQRPDQTGGVIPELPSDASPVAKQVTSTINNFLSNPGQAMSGLGEALQGLLGDGQAANITEG